MSWIRGLSHRLRSLFSPAAAERELEDEIAFHLEMQTTKHRDRGLTNSGARRAAHADFGRVADARDAARDARGAPIVEEVVQDTRYALRVLRSRPGFTAIAVLTLAIGIGANTAIFSVINAAILRPLPFREPERLMTVMMRMPVEGGRRYFDMVWSYANARVFRESQLVFAAQSVHSTEAVTIASEEGADRIVAQLVEASFFPILGLQAARGRVFLPDEDREGAGAPVVLLTDGLWRSRFGGDAGILDRTMQINGRPFRVIGVLPSGFRGTSGNAELFALITAVRSPGSLSPRAHNLEMIARLRDGVTIAAAKAAMPAAAAEVERAYPSEEGAPWGVRAYSFDEVRLDPALRRSVLVLGAAVVLVLLIACVNLANLILARGAARRRELAVRLAIGADRGRLIRQLLTESLVLSLAGAIIGLGFAWVLVRALVVVAPETTAAFSAEQTGFGRVALSAIALDTRAVLFATVCGVATGLLFGLVPALGSARTPLGDAMRQGNVAPPVFAGLRSITGRGALVVTEIALAMVLLVTSGLMIRSLGRLLEARVGYDPSHVLTARVSLNATRYSGDSAGVLWNEVIARLRALPGVTSVGVASCAPVGDNCEGTGIQLRGRSGIEHIGFVYASDEFFESLRVPIVAGRNFSSVDRREAPAVTIVNEVAARTIWGSDDPLRTPIVTDEGSEIRVVGVVGDMRMQTIETPPAPTMFRPYTQAPRSRGVLFIRTTHEPGSIVALVRREIRAADRLHAVHDIKTLPGRMRDATARSRFNTIVLAAFAATALILAAMGIYGVLALAVAQRTRELGIRLALGAEAGRLLRMVLGQALSLAAIGGVAGVIAAVLTSRALASLLFGVAPLDLPSFLGSFAALTVATIAAALVPAIRATRVSPLTALRSD